MSGIQHMCNPEGASKVPLQDHTDALEGLMRFLGEVRASAVPSSNIIHWLHDHQTLTLSGPRLPLPMAAYVVHALEHKSRGAHNDQRLPTCPPLRGTGVGQGHRRGLSPRCPGFSEKCGVLLLI